MCHTLGMDENFYLSRDEVEPVEKLPGVYRRTLVTTDGMMLVEFSLDQGAIVPLHHHFNQQVGYVIQGEIEFTIGGVTRNCRAGDSYAMPGDVEHKVQALTDCVVIDIFAPPREDYR